jgi:hypothetical protein
LRAEIDLYLLRTSLRNLALTPYFSTHVLSYSDHLCRVIDYALTVNPTPPETSLRRLSHFIWQAHQYLAGSISKEAPYEVQFCLERALTEWAKKPCIITTGLLDAELNYHFNAFDPWAEVRALFPHFDTQGFDRVLVLIGLPRLYRHKPLFCIPLYHELGHFVDRHWGITPFIHLRSVQNNGSYLGISLSPPHWAEHFADLFAACYVGQSSTGLLQALGPNNQANATHPATADRIDLVQKFISGAQDPRLDVIRNVLQQISAPALKVRHKVPDLADSYDDLRPLTIDSEEYLHGLFEASWNYFSACEVKPDSPWTSRPLDLAELEKVVNDLTEKSIRNFSVKKMWSVNATP